MNFDFKKSLGQNFLVDKNIINKIIDSIDVNPDDLIIEIGPGAGSLTEELIKKDCDLICFEIDTRLKQYLNKFESNKSKIIYNDFLKVKIDDYINKNYNHVFFVGNLPYYITTAIINKIIADCNPYEIIIMIQKEVAQRYMAKPKSKLYNSLSVFLQYNFEIKKICDVSKECFNPKPKVDSIVLRLKSKLEKEKIKDIEFFEVFVKRCFSQKRKNLKNNLKNYNYNLDLINETLMEYGKSILNRAEEIEINEFIDIVNKLKS